MGKSLEKMIKSAVILPDVHLTDRLPKDYQPVRKFIQYFKPDKTILLGDFMDVSSLSAWDYDKKRPMEGRRYRREIDTANKELDFLQKYSKEVVYILMDYDLLNDFFIVKQKWFFDLITIDLVEHSIALEKYVYPKKINSVDTRIDNVVDLLYDIFPHPYHV